MHSGFDYHQFLLTLENNTFLTCEAVTFIVGIVSYTIYEVRRGLRRIFGKRGEGRHEGRS